MHIALSVSEIQLKHSQFIDPQDAGNCQSYNFKYFNNCLISVVDTLPGVLENLYGHQRPSWFESLHYQWSRISFDLFFDQLQPVRHPKCLPQASRQHSRRQMTSALVVHLPLKVSVWKRTFIWVLGEDLVASMKQDTLGVSHHSCVLVAPWQGHT